MTRTGVHKVNLLGMTHTHTHTQRERESESASYAVQSATWNDRSIIKSV